jgi:hypothetical protein
MTQSGQCLQGGNSGHWSLGKPGKGIGVRGVDLCQFQASFHRVYCYECIAARSVAGSTEGWDTFGDLSQAHPGMAGRSPQHHLDWLGHCLGDCTGASLLASTLGMIGIRAKRRASPRAVGSPPGRGARGARALSALVKSRLCRLVALSGHRFRR